MFPISLRKCLALLLLCMISFSVSDAHKVLLLPMDISDNVIYMARLGKALMERGHEVVLATGSTMNVPVPVRNSNITLDTYHNPNAPLATREKYLRPLLNSLFNYSVISDLLTRQGIWRDQMEEGKLPLKDAAFLKRTAERKYDLVITDAMMFTFYVLPFKLGLPYAIVGTDVISAYHRRTPYLPSYVPHFASRFTERMSFLERMQNTMMYIAMTLSYSLARTGSDVVREYAPEQPALDYMGLVSEASLFITLRDFYSHYPFPKMPDTISITNLMGRPPAKLRSSLETIMDTAQNGVVVVSFGTWMEKLPDYVTDKLVRAFGRSEHTILWEYGGKQPKDLPENIHLMRHIPQNSLLAHPTTVLFITDAGLNSLLDGFYQGIPMIAFPFGMYELGNAANFKSKGVAEVLDISTFTAYELENTMKALVDNPEYTKTSRHLSAIFKDIQKSTTSNPVFWIEQVIKHGAQHVRAHAYKMPWYQYLMVDIILLIVAVISITAFIFSKIVRLIFRIMCKRKVKKE